MIENKIPHNRYSVRVKKSKVILFSLFTFDPVKAWHFFDYNLCVALKQVAEEEPNAEVTIFYGDKLIDSIMENQEILT